MNWTKEIKGKLENEWNNQNADKPFKDGEFALRIGTTKYAVAKQRSNMGLVDRKVPYHHRDAKAVKEPLAAPLHVLFYEKDGQKHFCNVDTSDAIEAKRKARLIMYQYGLKEIFVLKPLIQLVRENITEVNF